MSGSPFTLAPGSDLAQLREAIVLAGTSACEFLALASSCAVAGAEANDGGAPAERREALAEGLDHATTALEGALEALQAGFVVLTQLRAASGLRPHRTPTTTAHHERAS